MTNMIMKRRTRGEAGHPPSCHDDCDPLLTPRGITVHRRRVKKAEKQQWRKEVRTIRNES